MLYKTDQTLFRWLFGFQNGGESSPFIPVDEEIWTWKERSVFFSLDIFTSHSFVFIDCSCLPNVRHALK